MADQSEIPEPTELIYAPSPSWAPIFVAGGLTLLGVATFVSLGIALALAGAVITIIGVIHWGRQAADQIERLPRRQKVTSAVIPATTLKKK